MAEKIIAYCVKCKEKVPVKNPEKTTMKNGNPAIKGVCSKCGTKVYTIQKRK